MDYQVIVHILCIIFNVWLLYRYWGGLQGNYFATAMAAFGTPGTFVLLFYLFIRKMGWQKYL